MLEELHERTAQHVHHGKRDRQPLDPGKPRARVERRRGREGPGELPRHAKDERRHRAGGRRRHRAEREPRRKRHHPHEHALRGQDRRERRGTHPEQCIRPELPRATSYDEARGIGHEHGKDQNHEDREGPRYVARLVDDLELRARERHCQEVVARGVKRVEQTRGKGKRDEVDRVVARATQDVAERDAQGDGHGDSFRPASATKPSSFSPSRRAIARAYAPLTVSQGCLP